MRGSWERCQSDSVTFPLSGPSSCCGVLSALRSSSRCGVLSAVSTRRHRHRQTDRHTHTHTHTHTAYITHALILCTHFCLRIIPSHPHLSLHRTGPGNCAMKSRSCAMTRKTSSTCTPSPFTHMSHLLCLVLTVSLSLIIDYVDFCRYAPAGFVTFNSIAAANTAAQTLHALAPGTVEVEMAPEAREVYWPGVAMSPLMRASASNLVRRCPLWLFTLACSQID